MFQGVIDEVQIALDTHCVVEDRTDDLDKDLVAVLFDDSHFDFGTFDLQRLQFVLPALSMQKLLFLPDHSNELEEHLHHGLALRNQRDGQSGADLLDSDVGGGVK